MSVRWPWLYLPFGHLRLSTFLGAAAIFLVVTAWTRRPVIAAVAVMAWLSAFEIVWQTGQYAFGRTGASDEFWFVAAVVSWPLLAHVLGVRPDPWWAGAFAVTFLVWVTLGFHSNWPTLPFSLRDEMLNEASKTALGVAYLLGGLRATARAALVPGLATGG